MPGRWKSGSGTLDTMCSSSPFTLLIADPMVNKPARLPSNPAGRWAVPGAESKVSHGGSHGSQPGQLGARDEQEPPARGHGVTAGSARQPGSTIPICWGGKCEEGPCLGVMLPLQRALSPVHWFWQSPRRKNPRKLEYLPPGSIVRVLRHLVSLGICQQEQWLRASEHP